MVSDVVKINPSVTLELGDGQKITINLEEAGQLIKGLIKFVQKGEYAGMTTQQIEIQKRKGSRNAEQTKIPHMSEAKRTAILKHLDKQLSVKPKTISNLLKGITYVPNHLPHIRRMLEDQRGVAKKRMGKRTFYYRR
jgi:hypothetical protein